MKIEIIKTGQGAWYFRVLAGNGKVLCHSQTYRQKRSATEAVALIQDGAFMAQVVERV